MSDLDLLQDSYRSQILTARKRGRTRSFGDPLGLRSVVLSYAIADDRGQGNMV